MKTSLLRLVTPEPQSKTKTQELGISWLKLRLPIELKRDLDRWCREHKISVQAATENLWRDFLERESRAPAPPVRRENLILEYYSSRTGNPIRDSDRLEALELLELSLEEIKLGILYSIMRNAEAGSSPIRSLKYCRGAIEEWAGSTFKDPGLLPWFVRHTEQQIQKRKETEKK